MCKAKKRTTEKRALPTDTLGSAMPRRTSRSVKTFVVALVGIISCRQRVNCDSSERCDLVGGLLCPTSEVCGKNGRTCNGACLTNWTARAGSLDWSAIFIMTSMTVATSVWWWLNSQREREMEMEKLEDFEIAERTFGKRRGKKCEKVCAR